MVTTQKKAPRRRAKKVKVEPHSLISESSGEDIPFVPSSEVLATASDASSDDDDNNGASEATLLISTRLGGLDNQPKTIKKELWELLDNWLNENPKDMPPCALRANYSPTPFEIPKFVTDTLPHQFFGYHAPIELPRWPRYFPVDNQVADPKGERFIRSCRFHG